MFPQNVMEKTGSGWVWSEGHKDPDSCFRLFLEMGFTKKKKKKLKCFSLILSSLHKIRSLIPEMYMYFS